MNEYRKEKKEKEIVTNGKRGRGQAGGISRYVTCLSDEVFFLLHSQDTSVLSIPQYVDQRLRCLLLRFLCEGKIFNLLDLVVFYIPLNYLPCLF